MATAAFRRDLAAENLLSTDLGLLDAAVWMPLEEESVTVSVHRGDAEDPLAGVVRFRRDPEPPVDLVLGRERCLDGFSSL